MSKVPHFKFYVNDFMNGTAMMSNEEVGVYIRLLCVLYDQDGQVENDPGKLRHLLHCARTPEARRKIQRLIDLGKLSVDAEGLIHNGRADVEIEKRHISEPLRELKGAGTLPKTAMNSRARAQASLPYIFNSKGKDPSSARDSAPRRRTNDWDLPPARGPNGQTPFLQQWKDSQ
jgi:uncharacterized protein YdaU (DUF1376 family)